MKLLIRFITALSIAIGMVFHACSQTKTTGNAARAYCNAISEYVKIVYKDGVPRPDTLFIGKNVDMPNIRLPRSIQGITTFLVTSEAAEKKLNYRNSLSYLNVVGWLDKQTAEFIIVAFTEFKPQHTCSMYFRHDATFSKMTLDSTRFKYPPFGKP